MTRDPQAPTNQRSCIQAVNLHHFNPRDYLRIFFNSQFFCFAYDHQLMTGRGYEQEPLTSTKRLDLENSVTLGA